MNLNQRGNIIISWEIKDEDGIVVAVDFSTATRRLPAEYRRKIVSRLRETLTPRKKN